MTPIEKTIREEILDLVRRKGPIGWYGVEHGLRIARDTFPDGCNVMTYLTALENERLIVRNEAGKYIHPEQLV